MIPIAHACTGSQRTARETRPSGEKSVCWSAGCKHAFCRRVSPAGLGPPGSELTNMLSAQTNVHRVRVTGSGPTKGMPALSAAWSRGSSSGQDTVTKGTPLRTVLSHPIPTPRRQPGRENRAQSRYPATWSAAYRPNSHSHQPFSTQQLPNHRLIRHPSFVA
eukprot:351612-Chlamydomonas_euryale.AAC.22